MKQQTIYEVAVIPIGTLNTIRSKETEYSYFSNLSKCLDQLTTALAINGWEIKINYTAVYCNLEAKGEKTKVSIAIEPKILDNFNKTSLRLVIG